MRMNGPWMEIALPPVKEGEALRYARCGGADEQGKELLKSCIMEAGDIKAKVCFQVLPCQVEGDNCHFGAFSVSSRDLSGNLQGCKRVALFAITLGVGMDRLIQKYRLLSPSRALMMQALGAERVERGCDAFCRQLEQEMGPCRARFSPGYGDVPLEVQKEVFSLLPCGEMGLYLNDSLLMSPSKSVTAFVGIEK